MAVQLADSRPGGRNDALNKAAFRLGKMIVRGWTDEKTVTDALVGACDANRYLREHGHRAMMKTIESAIEAGKKDPHPDLPEREPLDDRRPTIAQRAGSGPALRYRLYANCARAVD